MKKILLSLLAALSALGPGLVCSAQEETPAKVKVYGFIRNYMVFDTHEVSAGTQDLYFYMPKDRGTGSASSRRPATSRRTSTA